MINIEMSNEEYEAYSILMISLSHLVIVMKDFDYNSVPEKYRSSIHDAVKQGEKCLTYFMNSSR